MSGWNQGVSLSKGPGVDGPGPFTLADGGSEGLLGVAAVGTGGMENVR